MFKKMVLTLLLISGICYALDLNTFSPPFKMPRGYFVGDGAVQVVHMTAKGYRGDTIESVYADNVVFVGYSTSYDFATGSTAIWYDRGPLGNSVASQTVEANKPGITVTHGCKAISGANTTIKRLQGTLNKIVGNKFSFAILYSSFAKFDGTTRYLTLLGDLSPYYSLRPDTAAGGGISKLFIEQTGGTYSVTASDTFLASDTFYTLIGTFDGAAANTKYYVNGAPASTVGTVPNTPTIDNGTFNFMAVLPSYGCDVRVVVFAIFDKKLSDEEAANVHTLMQNAKAYIASGGTM